jgi:hypothetical protein
MNNNNMNNVDDIMVVHKIPKLTRSGMAPRAQLGIMVGNYDDITCHELDHRYEAARLLAAVEKNAKANGVAVIPHDD